MTRTSIVRTLRAVVGVAALAALTAASVLLHSSVTQDSMIPLWPLYGTAEHHCTTGR